MSPDLAQLLSLLDRRETILGNLFKSSSGDNLVSSLLTVLNQRFRRFVAETNVKRADAEVALMGILCDDLSCNQGEDRGFLITPSGTIYRTRKRTALRDHAYDVISQLDTAPSSPETNTSSQATKEWKSQEISEQSEPAELRPQTGTAVSTEKRSLSVADGIRLRVGQKIVDAGIWLFPKVAVFGIAVIAVILIVIYLVLHK